MGTFTEKELGHNSALRITSYLSVELSKILPHSKIIKNATKLLVFGEDDSCHLSNFLQTLIFWIFDHISRTYNQINYRNICFAKVTIILTMMAQVFFSTYSLKKNHTLMMLSRPRLPAENPDWLFSIKLYGNSAHAAYPTFYFNQTQLIQSNPA